MSSLLMLQLHTIVLYNTPLVWLATTASACFTGWEAIPANKVFSFACLHVICMIAITANMEIIAAVNRKMSIAILSKNLFLVLFSCDVSSVWLFCLYCLTNPFSV